MSKLDHKLERGFDDASRTIKGGTKGFGNLTRNK